MVRQAVPLLDQKTRGPAHAEVRGKRKSNRAAADDQDRCFQSRLDEDIGSGNAWWRDAAAGASIADFTPTINVVVRGSTAANRPARTRSDRLDVGSADDATPFLGLVLDQLSEIPRRSDHNVAIHVGELPL